MAGAGDLASSTLAALATAAATSAAAASSTVAPDSPGNCVTGNDYDGYFGARISSIFVILIGGFLGACFPTFAARHRGTRIPGWAFFIAKYFGSGVIIATAFVHVSCRLLLIQPILTYDHQLLSPANDALRDPCLTGPITEYDWVAGICLITVFVLFFTELMAMRFAVFDPTRSHSHSGMTTEQVPAAIYLDNVPKDQGVAEQGSNSPSHMRGEDHLGHVRTHSDAEQHVHETGESVAESYSAQMTAIFILEFGVIFHSIFVGLTLAVAGPDEFATLYVVLVFHQTFEGLGLGSRLAAAPWPKDKLMTPYIMGAAYSLSTPIAIAIGLGIKSTWSPGSQTALITNGVFDSISAGILIYTGLVELMAHEFMFSNTMRTASMGTVLSAIGCMVAGAGE